jgi:hypothetical protein
MFNTLFTLYTVFWYSLSRCMCVTWSWHTCILAFGFALKSGCDTPPSRHLDPFNAAVRYSAVVNYAGAVEIPLLPHHPASSSSSALTAASQSMSSTVIGGFSAPTAKQQPQTQGPHTYVQRLFVSPGAGTFNGPYFQLMHGIVVCFCYTIF